MERAVHKPRTHLSAAKLTCSMAGGMKDAKGGHIEHAVPGLFDFTTNSGMSHWPVTFGVKYDSGE